MRQARQDRASKQVEATIDRAGYLPFQDAVPHRPAPRIPPQNAETSQLGGEHPGGYLPLAGILPHPPSVNRKLSPASKARNQEGDHPAVFAVGWSS